jgi:hypothetical protein
LHTLRQGFDSAITTTRRSVLRRSVEDRLSTRVPGPAVFHDPNTAQSDAALPKKIVCNPLGLESVILGSALIEAQVREAQIIFCLV